MLSPNEIQSYYRLKLGPPKDFENLRTTRNRSINKSDKSNKLNFVIGEKET